MSKQDAKRALLTTKNALKKKFGNTVFVDTTVTHAYEVISTGSAIIDDATGVGGLVEGKLVEIHGPESSGKSSICYSIAAQAQKKHPDKYVAYIDTEHAVSLPYMAQFGVDISEDGLLFTQPSSAEEALEIFNELAMSGACSLIILDSVAAMPTLAQLERGMDEKTMGGLANLMSVAVTQINNSCAKTGTTGVFVNQVRDSLKHGGGESTPGGRTLKFAAAMRIRTAKRDTITDPTSKKAIGQEVNIIFKKNKVGTPYQTVDTKLIFAQGFDFEFEYVDIAESYGIISRGGAWYSFLDSEGTPMKFQGKVNTAKHLKANPIEFEYIKGLVKEAQKTIGPIITVVPPEADDDLDDPE